MSERLLRLVGLLLMAMALAIPLARAPDRPVQSLVARWAPPPSNFIDVNGQLVHFRDEGPRGDAMPLLLLHGLGSSLHTWQGWLAALRAGRRVTAIDLPGSGLTGPYTGAYTTLAYRADDLARVVADVMRTLNVPRFAVAGNGLGGEVAWHLAAAQPQQVQALILVAATGYPDVQGTAPRAVQWLRTPLLGRLGDVLLPRPVVGSTLEAAWGDPLRLSAETVDRSYELTLRSGNREALRAALNEAPDAAAIDKLRSLRLPTLILWGTRDRITPPAAATRFGRDIRSSRVLMFDTLGAMPQEEDALATVAAARSFLAVAASAGPPH